jgi:O-antigen/teichoic acid export membrane protein
VSESEPPPVAAAPNMTGTAALNAVMGVAARVSGIAVGIVLTPFVLHRIGPELYGISATAGAVLEYLWLLRGGLGGGMRRYVTLTYHAGDRPLAERYYAAGFWWSGILRLLVVGSGIAMSRFLCEFMRISPNLMSDATGGLILIFVTAGISDVGSIFEVPIYASGHTSSISFVRVITMALRVGLVVPVFLLFVPGLRTYGLALLAAETLSTLMTRFIGARPGVVRSMIPRPDFGSPEVRSALFRFSGIGLVSQAAAILYLTTDNLLIGRIYGPAQVTEYALGTRWAPMIQSLLWSGIAALMPLFTHMEARGDDERTRAALTRSAAVITAISVPLCLVPCVVGDVFLEHWVGPQYRHCVSYMMAMLLPMLVGMPLEPLWVGMVARGRIGWIAVGDVIAAVINPFLSLLLALQFGLGPLGFALGNTIALLLKNLLLRPMMNRGETALPPIGRTMMILPVALAGGAPALLLLYFLKPHYSQSLVTVATAGAIGGVLCLIGSAATAVGPRDGRRILDALVARVRQPR